MLGTALPGLEMCVVDPETYEELPERHVGELLLRGTSVTPGYYKRDDATAALFRDGWLCTGDLAYLLDGQLVLCGRIKDVIIVGGGPGCVSDPVETKDPIEKRIEDEILGLMPEVCAQDVPFLGCCYGMGVLGHHLSPGFVSKEQFGEPVGGVDCTLTDAGKADPLLDGLPEGFRALVGHKEAVQALPEGAVHLVHSAPTPFQMLRYGKNVYATQFHPEADAQGFETRINIYKHKGYFPPERAEDLIAEIRSEDIRFPEMILRNFKALYAR